MTLWNIVLIKLIATTYILSNITYSTIFSNILAITKFQNKVYDDSFIIPYQLWTNSYLFWPKDCSILGSLIILMSIHFFIFVKIFFLDYITYLPTKNLTSKNKSITLNKNINVVFTHLP